MREERAHAIRDRYIRRGLNLIGFPRRKEERGKRAQKTLNTTKSWGAEKKNSPSSHAVELDASDFNRYFGFFRAFSGTANIMSIRRSNEDSDKNFDTAERLSTTRDGGV